MRCKQGACNPYVKTSGCAKTVGSGKAKDWQPALAHPRIFDMESELRAAPKMQCKPGAPNVYVKTGGCAKISGSGKAKDWQPVLAHARIFMWKVSFESSAEDAMQARSVQAIRKNMWVCVKIGGSGKAKDWQPVPQQVAQEGPANVQIYMRCRLRKPFPSIWPREVPATYKSIREVAFGGYYQQVAQGAGGPRRPRRRSVAPVHGADLWRRSVALVHRAGPWRRS